MLGAKAVCVSPQAALFHSGFGVSIGWEREEGKADLLCGKSRFTARLARLGFTSCETGEGRDDSVQKRGYRIAATGFTKFWDRLPLRGGCVLAPFIVFSRCRNRSGG